METYWVLRNGSIECRVATNVGASVAATAALAAHPGQRGQHGATVPVARAGKGRLTRRGRVVASAIALAFAAPLVSAGAVAAASSPPDPVQLVPYTVAAGESLWTIAENHKQPGTDTRDEVARIMRANHLGTSGIYAGEVLYLAATN